MLVVFLDLLIIVCDFLIYLLSPYSLPNFWLDVLLCLFFVSFFSACHFYYILLLPFFCCCFFLPYWLLMIPWSFCWCFTDIGWLSVAFDADGCFWLDFWFLLLAYYLLLLVDCGLCFIFLLYRLLHYCVVLIACCLLILILFCALPNIYVCYFVWDLYDYWLCVDAPLHMAYIFFELTLFIDSLLILTFVIFCCVLIMLCNLFCAFWGYCLLVFFLVLACFLLISWLLLLAPFSWLLADFLQNILDFGISSCLIMLDDLIIFDYSCLDIDWFIHDFLVDYLLFCVFMAYWMPIFCSLCCLLSIMHRYYSCDSCDFCLCVFYIYCLSCFLFALFLIIDDLFFVAVFIFDSLLLIFVIECDCLLFILAFLLLIIFGLLLASCFFMRDCCVLASFDWFVPDFLWFVFFFGICIFDWLLL